MDEFYNEFYYSYLVCEKGSFEQIFGCRWDKKFPCESCEKKLDPSCVVKRGEFFRYYETTPKENAILLLVGERELKK